MNPPNDEDYDEDEALWAYVTRDVTPLPGNEKRPPVQKKKVGRSERTEMTPADSRPAIKSAKAGRDLDRRTQNKLERGQIDIEARIDLHGMTQEQAHEALKAFITRCYGQGKRLVLVITGKGTRTQSEDDEWWDAKPGVLKQKVPGWLDDKPLQDIVLKYHRARPHHGGDGALYVLLRRQR